MSFLPEALIDKVCPANPVEPVIFTNLHEHDVGIIVFMCPCEVVFIEFIGTEIQDVNAVFCEDFLNSTEHFYQIMFRQQVIHRIKGDIRISLSGDSDHVFGQITAGTKKTILEKHARQISRAAGNVRDMPVFDAVFPRRVFNHANICVNGTIAPTLRIVSRMASCFLRTYIFMAVSDRPITDICVVDYFPAARPFDFSW